MKVKFIGGFLLAGAVVLLTACPGKKDTLDSITKDLGNDDRLSLSFDKAMPEAGMSKTSYGVESFLTYADPQDLICGEPFRIKYKAGIPIWRIPKIIQPTCPTMIPFEKADLFKNVLASLDKNQFGALKEVKLANGAALLGNDAYYRQYSAMKTDAFEDSALANLDGSKFLLLRSSEDMFKGANRDFYGTANLTGLVTAKKINWKDILVPRLKGCFDPLILKQIKDQLVRINPDVYKNLAVRQIGQDSAIAVLQ